jgi:uncharacterized protein (DUF1697 family)
METCVLLLRGINVGGKGSLPMKELAAVLGKLGCRNVKTYIQSGNAVFQHENADLSKLAGQIGAGIRKRRGFAPHVLVLDRKAFQTILAKNPFPEAESDPKSLHVGFLDAVPAKPDLEKLESLRKKTERFRLIGKVFYLHAPEGVGRSKLAAASEKALGVPMTDRNWNTVAKLMEMLRESG